MADFNQQDQKVDRQWNAGRDMNFSYRQVNNQQGQRVGQQYNAGRDIHTQRIYNDNAPKASTVFVKGIITIVILLLIGGGVALAFPAVEGFLGKAWHSLSSVTQNNSLDRTLYGNPKSSLEQFCTHLRSGDVQGAYNDYSAHLQAQISLTDFTNTWNQNGEVVTNCVGQISTESDTSATGKLLISTETINGGVTNNSSTYNVTLVSSDGIWRIDAMDKQ